MPFLESEGRRSYYRVWTSSTPRIAQVVYVHGFGEHSGLYHRLGDFLAARGIDLWALDQVGHGLSDGVRRGDIEDLETAVANVRALTDLAAEADPAVPIVLAGHSLGAAIAGVVIGRDGGVRYRAGVLSGAPLSELGWVRDLRSGGTFELSSADLSTDPFYIDEIENDPLGLTDTSGAASLADVLPPAWEELARTLPEITVPVLFLHGEQDPIVPVGVVRHWAEVLGDRAQVAVFAGARHDVLNESVHLEVAERLVRFVRDVAVATALVR